LGSIRGPKNVNGGTCHLAYGMGVNALAGVTFTQTRANMAWPSGRATRVMAQESPVGHVAS